MSLIFAWPTLCGGWNNGKSSEGISTHLQIHHSNPASQKVAWVRNQIQLFRERCFEIAVSVYINPRKVCHMRRNQFLVRRIMLNLLKGLEKKDTSLRWELIVWIRTKVFADIYSLSKMSERRWYIVQSRHSANTHDYGSGPILDNDEQTTFLKSLEVLKTFFPFRRVPALLKLHLKLLHQVRSNDTHLSQC